MERMGGTYGEAAVAEAERLQAAGKGEEAIALLRPLALYESITSHPNQ